MAIKRLRMKNFRLHEDNEIVFDDTAQLTLLAGTNGAGKSTVLEAIHYVMWAEGRTPKTRLDSLVRAGAELEGMTVELDLEHNGHFYEAVRRYADGMSHATVSMDGTVVTQGPREVTRFFSQLFGMDVRGFNLAVFAPQKQLNGLTSLSAARRAQTVSRLIRADVFTKARDDARAKMNDTKRLLQNLGELPDLAELEEARDARAEEFDAAKAAFEEAAAEASRLEEELRDGADVQERFRAANAARAHAEGQVSAATAAKESALKELEDATAALPERPDAPDVNLSDLEDELDRVSERLTIAREAASADRDREVLGKEIAVLTGEQTKLADKVEGFRGNVQATSAVVRAEQTLTQVGQDLDDLAALEQDARSDLAVAQAALSAAEKAVERLSGLDATCPTCEQGIPDEHRESQTAAARTEAEAQAAAVRDLLQQVEDLEGEKRAQQAARVEAQSALDMARKQEADISAAETQLQQVERTLSLYQRRVDALPPSGEPAGPLAEKRATLVAQIQAARAADRAVRDWERADTRRENASLAAARAALELDRAEEALEAAAVPQELVDAVDALGVLAAKLASERELASECSTLAAVAEQRLSAAHTTLAQAEEESARRANLVSQAEQSEAAARLLAASASHMTSQIRPALEGAVGSLLSTMSEGRYDAVKIDRDYNVQVRVDTGFRPLSEMSGGEQDLVALALRLGLSRIVTTAHGSTGPGFLVLDEVFGSQDVRRREMIVEALKSLRKIFPQVLLVSHVGGAEDQVDQVIQFELVEGDEQSGTSDSSLVTVT